MTIFAYLLFSASAVTFTGYVPPHAASDGLRFQVAAAAGSDVPATMRACGVEDFAALAGGNRYQFAVTRATETNARCVVARLPAGTRLIPVDRWANAD